MGFEEKKHFFLPNPEGQKNRKILCFRGRKEVVRDYLEKKKTNPL